MQIDFHFGPNVFLNPEIHITKCIWYLKLKSDFTSRMSRFLLSLHSLVSTIRIMKHNKYTYLMNITNLIAFAVADKYNVIKHTQGETVLLPGALYQSN